MEALIALAVMAVVTGMFVNALQSSAIARQLARDKREAVMVARSRLAMAMADRSAPSSGEESGLAWRTDVAGYRAGANGPGLEQVSVWVMDSTRQRTLVRLRSLRLAR